MRLLFVLPALAACVPEATPVPCCALDHLLRVDHVQALGTHNSYHLETPGITVPEWAYSHLPLDEQILDQGVRQFELDMFWSDELGEYEVLHVPVIDAATTCETLRLCLLDMWAAAAHNPHHHPMVVLLEMKDAHDEATIHARLQSLEAEVAEIWPRHRMLIPDDVQGEADSLREALEEHGWPTLDVARGRTLFVLHSRSWVRTYTEDDTTTRGRLFFPDAYGDLSLPYAAFHSRNDPVGAFASIQALVEAGHLVRTRTDANNVEPLDGDTSRLEAALASGAHFLSTDYPAEREGVDYVARIPEGTPSRCNPLSAPAECTSRALEEPLRLRGTPVHPPR